MLDQYIIFNFELLAILQCIYRNGTHIHAQYMRVCICVSSVLLIFKTQEECMKNTSCILTD